MTRLRSAAARVAISLGALLALSALTCVLAG